VTDADALDSLARHASRPNIWPGPQASGLFALIVSVSVFSWPWPSFLSFAVVG
jgi:hypothetical protein